MSTKIEQKVAHDEKSKFFISRAKIAYHTTRNVVGIFLERFILIPENEEILFGLCDQRKRRRFSVRCYIQINPHFQFASLLTAHLCPETSLIRVNE